MLQKINEKKIHIKMHSIYLIFMVSLINVCHYLYKKSREYFLWRILSEEKCSNFIIHFLTFIIFISFNRLCWEQVHFLWVSMVMTESTIQKNIIKIQVSFQQNWKYLTFLSHKHFKTTFFTVYAIHSLR